MRRWSWCSRACTRTRSCRASAPDHSRRLQGHAQEHAVRPRPGRRTSPRCAFDYAELDGELLRREDVPFVKRLMASSTNQLLLQTDGDVEEALRWMARARRAVRHLHRRLRHRRAVPRSCWRPSGDAERATGGGQGSRPRGEKRIRQESLDRDLLDLARGADGRSPHAGTRARRRRATARDAALRSSATTPSDLDPLALDAATRSCHGTGELALAEDDLEVFETEHLDVAAPRCC